MRKIPQTKYFILNHTVGTDTIQIYKFIIKYFFGRYKRKRKVGHNIKKML